MKEWQIRSGSGLSQAGEVEDGIDGTRRGGKYH